MSVRHVLAVAALVTASAAALAQQPNVPTPTTPAPAVPVTTPDRGTATPVIDKREQHQQERIRDARASGELTKHEARRLRAEQKGIDHMQKRAEADGTVTAKERQHIRRAQHRAAKDIHQQKHDAASAPATGK